MNEQRIGVWPATGVAPGIMQLEKTFGEMVLNKFPKGFINSWHFDDKANMKSQYKNTKVNILKNSSQTQFTQQRKPRLTIIFNNTNANQPDAAGGDESPFTYPLVQGVHPKLNGYIPIYKDPNNIGIYMSHKRIRVTFNAILEVESLSDQENCLNFIENMFKMQYGSFMEFVPTQFILPNDMINTIYKLLFIEEIVKITQIENQKEKDKLYAKIGKEFYTILNKYSSCNGISQYTRANNPNDNYFLYKQIYRKLYYEITSRPEKTDGERIGSVYGKYTVTFDGFMEFEKPIAYILVTPDIVAGNSVSEVLRSSGNIDYFRDHIPSGFMKYFKRKDKVYPRLVEREMENNIWQLIYEEHDVSMDSPNDIIDLCEWINESKYGQKLKNYTSFLKVVGKENFSEYFKVFIYHNDNQNIIDQLDMMWDGEILHINNTDSTELYSIYVLCNTLKCNHEIMKMIGNKKSEEIMKE